MGNRRFLVLMPWLLCAMATGVGNTRTYFPTPGLASPNPTANRNCRKWQGTECTECGINSSIGISLKNKTKTPLLLCQDMKSGPAKLEMTTHAGPELPGLWEVEL